MHSCLYIKKDGKTGGKWVIFQKIKTVVKVLIQIKLFNSVKVSERWLLWESQGRERSAKGIRELF